jgi:hypothetical protein
MRPVLRVELGLAVRVCRLIVADATPRATLEEKRTCTARASRAGDGQLAIIISCSPPYSPSLHIFCLLFCRFPLTPLLFCVTLDL